MTRVSATCLLSLGIYLACGGALAAEPEAKLVNKKLQESVHEEVLPAFRQGNAVALLQALSPLAAKLDTEHLAAVDKLLAENSAPPVDQLLTDARLNLVQQNLAAKLPEPSQRELLLVLGVIKQRLEEALDLRDSHPAMANSLPRPRDLTAYRDLLWTIHVYQNRLVSAGYLAQYAAALKESAARTNQKSLSEAQRELVATDFKSIFEELSVTRRELEERELELRIARLDMAVDVLAESKDGKERFFAAFAVDFDGQLLAEIFSPDRKDDEDRFLRAGLNNERLAGYVRGQTARGQELAGKLLVKSRLLFNGLRWWTRGRYGRGPEAGGLLKSPAALRSLEAQVALYMPQRTPRPTDPLQPGARVPDYDRRHHYLWAWEDRQLQLRQAGRSQANSSQLVSKEESGTDFFY